MGGADTCLSIVWRASMESNNSPSARTRIVLAFCFSPLLAPFYGAFLFAQPWALPIGLLITYPSAIVFGIPSFLLLRRRSVGRQWWAFAAWGALCSTPALIVYAVCKEVPHLESFTPLNGLALVAWGTFSGLCFWLLGVAGDSPVRWRDVLDMGPPSN
jgi:hypothetical protein